MTRDFRYMINSLINLNKSEHVSLKKGKLRRLSSGMAMATVLVSCEKARIGGFFLVRHVYVRARIHKCVGPYSSV